MAVKKKGLGRGLDALFPEKPAEKKPVPKPITKEVNSSVFYNRFWYLTKVTTTRSLQAREDGELPSWLA